MGALVANAASTLKVAAARRPWHTAPPGAVTRYIDITKVAPLLQSFSESAGIASAIIDPAGVVLCQANWQPLCTEFHRRHPRTLARCIESDTALAAQMLGGKDAALYTCPNGLIDAVAPVVVNGEHVVNAFVGQFFLAPPDIEAWKRRADRYGFHRTTYLQAVAQVPVLSEARVHAALGFLVSSTQLLVELGREILEKERAQHHQRRTLERLRLSVDAAVNTLARTVEIRDPYTAGHQERTTELALAIGRRLGLAPRAMTSLRIASLVHDLGKVSIPAEVLAKPGRLNEFEWQLIRQHPETGYQILREMHFPGPVATIVRAHHERLDGSGYPRGLRDGQIRREAGIIAVADVVEAMSSHRPYRAALGIEAALEEISAQRGLKYDPQVVDACLALFHQDGFAFSSAS